MTPEAAAIAVRPAKSDYTLTGARAADASAQGLAEADWYQSPVPRETMRRLLERRDGPAVRDTLLWFFLIIGSAFATWWLWPSWWAALPYLSYSVLYASTSDSRWHEAGHGTAFKTDWMNNALYEIASFMVMRESIVWRWSHTRHHSDTIIVGRDPEIAVPRPPDIAGIIKSFFNLPVYPAYFRKLLLHSLGRIEADEKTYIPESQFAGIYRRARLSLAIYLAAVALAVVAHSILPLLFIGLPNLFGSWLMVIYGLTQHAGLAENVLDHRLNCRTVYMNPVNRYLYWNMNYHVEHHMFPLVPYHALPRLHAAVKHDLPTPYSGLLAAYREIIPTVLRQVHDPAYHVRRTLPAATTAPQDESRPSAEQPDRQGWIEICAGADLAPSDVIRFDHGKKTFALYRDGAGRLYATDGICTHGNTHLANGLVKDDIIECPKHNGRFHLRDGSPARVPICRGLATYPIEERSGRLWLNIQSRSGAGAREQKLHLLRVVSNENVATFIKELVLEPVDPSIDLSFVPGDYLQFDIPIYPEIRFQDFNIAAPYAGVWHAQGLFNIVARNLEAARHNNYSLASHDLAEGKLRFNIRIATPPPGQDCPPGTGSAYMFNLRPGDVITATGPFGDFHVKPTQKEMVYIGTSSGMAPLRAHLSHLFETDKTRRKVSFWYGARTRQELYYTDYFEGLMTRHSHFHFYPILSAPLNEDNWMGLRGYVHEVVRAQHLESHLHPTAIEFYLCGSPMMLKACTRMLESFGVTPQQIAFDEF